VGKSRWGMLRLGSQRGWTLARTPGLFRATWAQAAARPRSARAQRRRRGSTRAPLAGWRPTRTRLRRCCAPATAPPPPPAQVPAHTSPMVVSAGACSAAGVSSYVHAPGAVPGAEACVRTGGVAVATLFIFTLYPMHAQHHCDDGGQVRMMTRPGICPCRCPSSSRGRASARWRRSRPVGRPTPGRAPAARPGWPRAARGAPAAPAAREPEQARGGRSGAWRTRCMRRGWLAPRLMTTTRAHPAARVRVRALAFARAKQGFASARADTV